MIIYQAPLVKEEKDLDIDSTEYERLDDGSKLALLRHEVDVMMMNKNLENQRGKEREMED